jgi:pyruvate/2-oxoglutarate dehydrogenase complex dihydrolipoamide acyltransferase (E2) component
MTESTPIVVPRENVNDESARLVAWAVAEGARVVPGQPVVQIETSKAVVDLPAPAGGVLRLRAHAGEEVPIGGVLGWVVGEGIASAHETHAVPDPAANGHEVNPQVLGGHLPLSPAGRRLVAEEKIDPAQVKGTGRGGRITKTDLVVHLATGMTPARTDAPKPARFSPQARALIEQLGLDEHSFLGHGLVRSSDVRSAVEPRPATPLASAPTPWPALAVAGVVTRSERLSRAKRVEAKSLKAGAEATLPSVVVVACPTRGFRAAVARQAAVGGNATAVILAETARLLRKYPAFNAYHEDGTISCYQQVNIGFAVDAGRGLKVPVIRDADRKEIATIAAEMHELVVAYLDDRLTVESLAGGTFTVTDLSGEDVAAFHPLISRGQAAILGICSEVSLPGAAAGAFNLVLGFDHQLSEGRVAARFLGELRARLAHYEATFLRGGPMQAEEPRCSRCQAGYHELAANGHALVQSVHADGSLRLLCKLCFEGWT